MKKDSKQFMALYKAARLKHPELKRCEKAGHPLTPITRSEAADIIKKCSAALKGSQRGHRRYFIMLSRRDAFCRVLNI
jgi:hypothetical protein